MSFSSYLQLQFFNRLQLLADGTQNISTAESPNVMGKLMETIRQIEEHFQTEDFYPSDAFIWETGKAVYEFPFIQKLSDKKYVVHIQRHHAINPFQLAEKKDWSFNNLRDAYKKWTTL